jgi:hypothetical protein
MKNHIVAVNKKVSNTPMTDSEYTIRIQRTHWVKRGFARQLELQLAGANKRIKKLETQVDEMLADGCYKETHE